MGSVQKASSTDVRLALGKGIASAVAYAFCYACFIVAAKFALEKGTPPLFLSGAAMGIGCLLICLFLGILGRLSELRQPTSSLVPLARIGLTGTAIQVCALFGLRLTTASNAAILTRTDLLFAILLGRLMLGERLSLRQLIACLVMLVGALRVLGLEPRPDLVSGHWAFSSGSLGDGLVMVSAFFVGLNVCQIKRQVLRVPGEVVAVYNTGIISFLSLLGALCAGDMTALPPLHAGYAALFLTMGVILFFLFLFYYFSLSRIPAWLARALALLTPAFALGLSALLLHERIRAEQVQGMFLVVAGAGLMVTFLRRPPARSRASPLNTAP